ncbi:hypothetical protein INT44_007938 [Umbelopsis vinacea]|uniref:LysM domain-containing protein n=1 Tax=Umbelopsis vinacea TaxID=44442 RepID=A0A8H7UDD0_9FUNG|nr:hypothetical protein INT44_007938 [Umbelopsis vinacea]
MKFLYILSASVLLHQAAVRASYQATAGSCPNTYEAQAGDTCPSIATKFKTTTNSLEAWNPNFDCSSLAANDILCISAPYNLPTTAASSTAASATTSAAPIPTAHPHGMTITLNSEKEFCMFLPPKAGGDVASSEKTARTFCTSKQKNAPGAKLFPDGLILSSHFVHNKTADYVQITGLLNPTAYNMSLKDEGGQFDVKSPHGAVCAGYSAFLAIVEPAQGDYCIRCCNTNTKELCTTGRSQDGCWNLIKGNYSGPKVNYGKSSAHAKASHKKTSSVKHSHKKTTHKTTHHAAATPAPGYVM